MAWARSEACRFHDDPSNWQREVDFPGSNDLIYSNSDVQYNPIRGDYMRLKNQVALITGAGRGIGRAIALAYAKEGAKLALAARTVAELEDTAKQAEALGAATFVVPADVSDEPQVNGMVQSTLEHFSKLDILVNNAGLPGPVGPLWENDVAYWIRTIEVNITGIFLCCRAVLPGMLATNRGKIINIYGGRGRNVSSYGASKVAVADLTETLSLELEGTNIQVNALSPGSIHTRMWEETRDAAEAIGDTELYEYGVRVTAGGGAPIERAAELAVFLASEASGRLSGRVIQATTDDFLESYSPDT